MIEKQETARAWWPGSSLKEYTDALQELSDRLKKETSMTPEDEEFERIAREIRRNAKEDDDIQEYKRPWVGLTDGEVEDYWDWEDFQTGAGRSTIFEMVRHIDATLKRKNNE